MYVQKFLAYIKRKTEHCYKTSPFSLTLTLAECHFRPYIIEEHAEDYKDTSSSEPTFHNFCRTDCFIIMTILLNIMTFTFERPFK